MAVQLQHKTHTPAAITEKEWLALDQAVDLLPSRDGAVKPHYKAAVATLKKYRNKGDVRVIFRMSNDWSRRMFHFNEFLKRNGFRLELKRLVNARDLYDASLIRTEG
ncbi:MAG: hypothetical protein KBC38_01090 [Candidatus Pacebacteria bacterium]|nr:hypothetical protein [Candidatus Paceibacterota bacterium]MBP9840232.1 hypothetical protein [Candidatus Paceibacterota bacterium]